MSEQLCLVLFDFNVIVKEIQEAARMLLVFGFRVYFKVPFCVSDAISS